MPVTPAAMLARAEGNARLVGIIKLGNVALAMLWGFAVTFVFVRLLPLAEFRAFLLLVAFANFTISADFGFSAILYARLRGHWLGTEDFAHNQLGALFGFMALVILVGGIAIAAALAGGLIPTRLPGLFLAFYLLSAMNIFALLAKRALSAIDRNLFWELLDAARRILSLALLLAALGDLPILASVLLQIALGAGVLLLALTTVGQALAMPARAWWAGTADMIATARVQAKDMGATMALTISDVAAYNAPYFALALASRDPRPVLLFDFVFKVSRALSAVIRALVEAGLPGFTAAAHRGAFAELVSRLARIVAASLGCALLLGGLLLVVGPALSHILFAGKVALDRAELGVLALLLAGLSMLCVSTYVHNALGRFGLLLPPSALFLVGSLFSVPAGALLAHWTGLSFALLFLAVYALVHCLAAGWHILLLQRLARR